MLVTTWGGFLAALQTEGAVIDLPGGVWDCNALVPSGFQDTIEITAAKVNGHGTVIRNLYGDMFAQTVYQGQTVCEFTNMQFQNLVTQNTISAAFTDCIITGMCQRGIGSLKRCAVNIKSEAANPFVFGTSGEDSQIKVYLPVMERLDDNASTYTGNSHFIAKSCKNCELIIDAPNAVGAIRPMYWYNVIMRGNCPGITTVIQYYDWEITEMSFVSSECCPSASVYVGPQVTQRVAVWPESYLNNAAALAAAGFPIEGG